MVDVFNSLTIINYVVDNNNSLVSPADELRESYYSLSFNCFYKKWKSKRKGKRYVLYQIIEQGIDPKFLEKIKVVKK